MDGSNLYAYVKNNPLRYLDPMGTRAIASRSDDYDVVDYIENITMSGGSNNNLLLMIQASEIAKTFIESENVQSIVNNPSNRFAINESTANLSKVWNNLTNSLADKSDVTMTYMSEKINSTVDGISNIINSKLNEIENNFSQEYDKAINGYNLANKQMNNVLNGIGNIYNGVSQNTQKMLLNAPLYAKLPLYTAGAISVGGAIVPVTEVAVQYVISNPNTVNDFLKGFDSKSPNIFNPTHSLGYGSRKVIELIGNN